jgi:hypothetical protein
MKLLSVMHFRLVLLSALCLAFIGCTPVPPTPIEITSSADIATVDRLAMEQAKSQKGRFGMTIYNIQSTYDLNDVHDFVDNYGYGHNLTLVERAKGNFGYDFGINSTLRLPHLDFLLLHAGYEMCLQQIYQDEYLSVWEGDPLILYGAPVWAFVPVGITSTFSSVIFGLDYSIPIQVKKLDFYVGGELSYDFLFDAQMILPDAQVSLTGSTVGFRLHAGTDFFPWPYTSIGLEIGFRYSDVGTVTGLGEIIKKADRSNLTINYTGVFFKTKLGFWATDIN